MTTSPKIRGAILGGTIRREQVRGDTLPPLREPSRECISPPKGGHGPWAFMETAMGSRPAYKASGPE